MTVSDALANLTDPASVGLLTVAGAFVLIAVAGWLWRAYVDLCRPYEPRYRDNTHCRICDKPCRPAYEGAPYSHCMDCCDEIAASTFIPDYYQEA